MVKCLNRSVCTESTNSKSKKTSWEWSKLHYSKCITYCKYTRFSGLFVALEACLGWNGNIHNDSQLVKVGFIHIQETHSGKDWRSQLWIIFNYRPGKPQQWKRHLSQKYPSHVSASDSLECGSEVSQNFNEMPAKAAALPRISGPMSYILTQVLNIAKSGLIAKWERQISSARSVMKICPGFSGAPESPGHISLWPIDYCIFAFPIWHTDSLSDIEFLCQDICGIAGAFAGLRLRFRYTYTSNNMGAKAPALPQISKPWLILRHKYFNIT